MTQPVLSCSNINRLLSTLYQSTQLQIKTASPLATGYLATVHRQMPNMNISLSECDAIQYHTQSFTRSRYFDRLHLIRLSQMAAVKCFGSHALQRCITLVAARPLQVNQTYSRCSQWWSREMEQDWRILYSKQDGSTHHWWNHMQPQNPRIVD